MGVQQADTSVALIFPGQGSHSQGMESDFRGEQLLDRALEVLGADPFERLGEGTRFQQPAVFCVSILDWQRRGRPDAVASSGHSLGEYAALVAAGALEFEAALCLVAERGAAMADAGEAEAGTMLAMLGGEAEAVRELAGELSLTIANDNAPGQLVLSGSLEAIGRAEAVAREQAGARPKPLDVSGAFHSPLMRPAAARLEAALDRVRFSEPRYPVLSCATAAPFVDPRRELAANLLRGVRWRETVLALREAGAEEFVEPGHGRALSGMVKRILPRQEARA